MLTRDAGAIEEVYTNAAGAAGSTIASEIVVENAKVLTVGQGADERQTSPQVVNSVTIEVTSDGAEDRAGPQFARCRCPCVLHRLKRGRRRRDDDFFLRRLGRPAG